jgi:DNA repair ATPase RecN
MQDLLTKRTNRMCRASRKRLRSLNNNNHILAKNRIDVYGQIQELTYMTWGMLDDVGSPEETVELRRSAKELAERINELAKSEKKLKQSAEKLRKNQKKMYETKEKVENLLENLDCGRPLLP